MKPRQAFSLLLPFIAASLHCISIQQNAAQKKAAEKTFHRLTPVTIEEHEMWVDSLYSDQEAEIERFDDLE